MRADWAEIQAISEEDDKDRSQIHWARGIVWYPKNKILAEVFVNIPHPKYTILYISSPRNVKIALIIFSRIIVKLKTSLQLFKCFFHSINQQSLVTSISTQTHKLQNCYIGMVTKYELKHESKLCEFKCKLGSALLCKITWCKICTRIQMNNNS